MPESKFEITQDYITLFLNEDWYCFPFIMLAEDEVFMKPVWEHFGIGADLKDKYKNPGYYQLLDRGPVKLIRDYLSAQKDPFAAMREIIHAQDDHFESMLEACKLYGTCLNC